MRATEASEEAASMTAADDYSSDQASTFKALFQVWLDVHGIFGLSQNLEKVITGQEVEAGELLPLVFQIVF